jgi:hypothetical protein
MRSKLKFVLGATWTAAIAAGFTGLAVYESRPGTEAAAPREWPARTRLTRDPDRWTLLMFLHPRCPCSQASLQELAELLSGKQPQVQTFLLCCKPPGVPDGWEQGETWRQAASMKQATVSIDEHDDERSCFGVQTSGHVLLYDPRGRLRYDGGITRARGHVGPNEGRAAVAALLRGEASPVTSGPVFGCPLVDPETSDSEKGCRCPDRP